MATRFIQNYVNQLINEQVVAQNPLAGSEAERPVDNRRRKKFPGRVEGDRPGGLTDADLDQMGPESGEAQPEPQPLPDRPGEMVASPGLGGTGRDEEQIRGGLQPEAPPPGSVDTSPTPIATPTPPASGDTSRFKPQFPSEPDFTFGRPPQSTTRPDGTPVVPPAQPAPPAEERVPPQNIGGMPNIGGIIPKEPGSMGPETSTTRPDGTPVVPPAEPAPPAAPAPEPGAPETAPPPPTPREVRTGQVNVSNTGTVVGAQGVGNQVGNITTGDVTTNTAPTTSTPQQRRQEPLPPDVKNAAAQNPSQSAEIINNYYNYGTVVGAMGAGNRVGSITTGGVATGAKARAGGATRTATATQPATGAQASGGVVAGGDVADKAGVEAAIRRRRQPITSSVDPALLRLNSILEQIAQEEEEERKRRVRTGDVNISNTGTVVGAQGVGNQVGNISTGNISTGSALTPREKRREGQGQPTQYPDQQEPPKQEAPDRIGGFPNIGGNVPKPGGDPGQSKVPDFVQRPEDDYMPPGGGGEHGLVGGRPWHPSCGYAAAVPGDMRTNPVTGLMGPREPIKLPCPPGHAPGEYTGGGHNMNTFDFQDRNGNGTDDRDEVRQMVSGKPANQGYQLNTSGRSDRRRR
jgi:hypothetical protein